MFWVSRASQLKTGTVELASACGHELAYGWVPCREATSPAKARASCDLAPVVRARERTKRCNIGTVWVRVTHVHGRAMQPRLSSVQPWARQAVSPSWVPASLGPRAWLGL